MIWGNSGAMFARNAPRDTWAEVQEAQQDMPLSCSASCSMCPPTDHAAWRSHRLIGRSLEDGWQGPGTRPGNAPSPVERRRVLAAVNSAEFRDLPPTRIVPRLADRGVSALFVSGFLIHEFNN